MSHEPLNVAAHLVRMATDQPKRVAIYYPRGSVKPQGESEHIGISFRELNDDVDAIARGLADLGIGRGTRTALMVPPSPDFFAIAFALFKIGAVPILIDPGMGVRNLGACLAEAEPEAFVGIVKAHLARRSLRWGRKTILTTVNSSRWRFFCNASLARLRKAGAGHGAYPIPDVARDEPAAILFTSGSTGVAKGAVYTHGNFAAQVEILKTTYGIEPGEIDLCTFPLFALFGPALGMTCVIPDMNPSRPAEIDPAKAIAQIRQFGVTNAFGSPAVIRRLSTQATDAAGVPQRLATLRRVISAGAPASPRDIEKFAKMLPETAQVFTPYGATEALPVANIGSREILGETRQLTELGKGVCVGKPVAGIEVYAIGITDEAIADWNDSLCVPPGAVGEFAVRGAVVTRRYYNRPDATRLAKIRDAKTGDAIHRMGDVGYLDERGRLWFCGRKSHRVETPTETLFTDTIEPIFNALPGVFRTALVGVIRKGQKHPVLCVELEGGVRPRGSAAEKFERTFAETAEKYPQAQKVRTFLFHRGFPVDVRHNSKIFREKLAVWADRKLGPSWEPPR